jgi:hypothetical protein
MPHSVGRDRLLNPSWNELFAVCPNKAISETA